MHKKKRKALATLLGLTLVSGTGCSKSSAAQTLTPTQPPRDLSSLEQIYDVTKDVFNGDETLKRVAYPYMGWRTSGGPWFNEVIEWSGNALESYGFKQGEELLEDSYWIQNDIPDEGFIWNPQYASLEIIEDHSPQPFRLVLNTFDPTSSYYPEDITYDWIKTNIGSEKEAQINQRCHLARESGFTDPPDTTVDAAKGITAEVVDIGEVHFDKKTQKYTWTQNTQTRLKGKMIFSTNNREDAYKLAIQEGAVASLSSEIDDYNNPIVNGKELYPDTVKYADVPNEGNAHNPLAFNVSPNDERYLTTLLKNAKKPIQMKAVAIGGFKTYSKENPLKTLVAEIKGSSKPDERVVIIAHVQEPGACDNASGIGLALELAQKYKHMIDTGIIQRPSRTITFLFGDEYTCSFLWRDAHPDQMLNVKSALVLDMVGENPELTGGSMRIEKSPDPSAKYPYGLDLLPGQTEPANLETFIRKPDKHTLWGSREPKYWPYPGTFLNDLYLSAATLVASEKPNFKVNSNPYEGGSDHDPFLWHSQNFIEENNEDYQPQWSPIPALLSWHFTDYVYHSSMDTLDKISTHELVNVGQTTSIVALAIAGGKESTAGEIRDLILEAAQARFNVEKQNSIDRFKWVRSNALKINFTEDATHQEIENALKEEQQILTEWAAWYKEAIVSARSISTVKVSAKYVETEASQLKTVDTLLKDAFVHASEAAGLN